MREYRLTLDENGQEYVADYSSLFDAQEAYEAAIRRKVFSARLVSLWYDAGTGDATSVRTVASYEAWPAKADRPLTLAERRAHEHRQLSPTWRD